MQIYANICKLLSIYAKIIDSQKYRTDPPFIIINYRYRRLLVELGQYYNRLYWGLTDSSQFQIKCISAKIRHGFAHHCLISYQTHTSTSNIIKTIQ